MHHSCHQKLTVAAMFVPVVKRVHQKILAEHVAEVAGRQRAWMHTVTKSTASSLVLKEPRQQDLYLTDALVVQKDRLPRNLVPAMSRLPCSALVGQDLPLVVLVQPAVQCSLAVA